MYNRFPIYRHYGSGDLNITRINPLIMAFVSKFCIRRLGQRALCTAGQPAEVPRSRVKRLVDYAKGILEDYRTVAVETWQDMKDRPIKSSFYISLIAGVVVLVKTNPGEKEFYTRITENSTELMLVGEPIRNKTSVSYVSHIAKEASESRLRCYNLGLFSLICSRPYGPQLGLYEANCKYVKPHWTEFHKYIIDIGVLGKWINLEKAMQNYDVQPDEWLTDGQPNEKYSDFIERNQNLISWDMKMK